MTDEEDLWRYLNCHVPSSIDNKFDTAESIATTDKDVVTEDKLLEHERQIDDLMFEEYCDRYSLFKVFNMEDENVRRQYFLYQSLTHQVNYKVNYTSNGHEWVTCCDETESRRFVPNSYKGYCDLGMTLDGVEGTTPIVPPRKEIYQSIRMASRVSSPLSHPHRNTTNGNHPSIHSTVDDHRGSRTYEPTVGVDNYGLVLGARCDDDEWETTTDSEEEEESSEEDESSSDNSDDYWTFDSSRNADNPVREVEERVYLDMPFGSAHRTDAFLHDMATLVYFHEKTACEMFNAHAHEAKQLTKMILKWQEDLE